MHKPLLLPGHEKKLGKSLSFATTFIMVGFVSNVGVPQGTISNPSALTAPCSYRKIVLLACNANTGCKRQQYTRTVDRPMDKAVNGMFRMTQYLWRLFACLSSFYCG